MPPHAPDAALPVQPSALLEGFSLLRGLLGPDVDIAMLAPWQCQVLAGRGGHIARHVGGGAYRTAFVGPLRPRRCSLHWSYPNMVISHSYEASAMQHCCAL